MKKLLGISLVAILAATPLMANAAGGTVVAGDPSDVSGTAAATATNPMFTLAEANTETDGNAASAGYVKGAYNAAIKAINKVDSDAKTRDGNLGTLKTTEKTNLVGAINEVKDAVDGIDTGVQSVTASETTEGVIVVDGSNVAVKGAVVEGKLDDGATGYDINAKSLQVQGVDAVTVSGTQTLTNKTIDADDNTITDLETDNFKNGVIKDVVREAASITDHTTLASEKAVRTAIDSAVTGLGMNDYAKKSGVQKTVKDAINDVTLTQGAVTQGLKGSISGTEGTIASIMTTWGSDTAKTDVKAITAVSNGTLATDVSVAAPTVNTVNSVTYTEPTTQG